MKRKGKGSGIGFGFLLFMPILTILLALLFSKLILSGVIPEKGISWCACVIVGVVALLLCLFSSMKSAQKKFLWGMTTACIYACLLLLGNLLFFGVAYGGNVPAVLATVLLSGMLGSLLGCKKRRKFA